MTGTGAQNVLMFLLGEHQHEGACPAATDTCHLCRPPIWMALKVLSLTSMSAGLVPWPMGCASATPDLLENVNIYPHYNSQSARTASFKVWNPSLPHPLAWGLVSLPHHVVPHYTLLLSSASPSTGNHATQPSHLTWLCCCWTY